MLSGSLGQLSMTTLNIFHWMRACVVLQLCLSGALASPTYYDTLNVEPTATGSQIKTAFRKLALKYHPDKSKSADAEKTFREIAEAYKVLSNKERRKLYDMQGHQALPADDQFFKDPQDERETGFRFSFADLYQEFDDGPFMEGPHIHWSFHQDGDEYDEYNPFERYSFDEPNFPSFLFGDSSVENEEEYYHY